MKCKHNLISYVYRILLGSLCMEQTSATIMSPSGHSHTTKTFDILLCVTVREPDLVKQVETTLIMYMQI